MRKYQVQGIAAMLEYVKLWKIYPMSKMMRDFGGILKEKSNDLAHV